MKDTLITGMTVLPLLFVLLMAAGGNLNAADDGKLETATFAGGCFWCMEPPFVQLEGVKSVTSGYTGGHTQNPTYQEVCEGNTGHAEAVQIVFDPALVSYGKLLEVFWFNIDPTQMNRQFADHGDQYRTAIFYHGEQQKMLAGKSKMELDKSGALDGPVVTQIVPAAEFYPAENYHQEYYKKNPLRYQMYRKGSGRESGLKKLWGDKAAH